MPSESDMVPCPVEGCDYGPMPRSSVLGHYSGKSDGRHPGGYQKAKELLGSEPSAARGADSDPKPEPKPEPKQDSQSKPKQSTGSNPTFGSADAEPEPEPSTEPREPQQNQQSSKQGEYVCLDCGSAVFDFKQYETGAYHLVNGHQVFVRGDFQCSQCGKWWMEE